MKGNHLIIKLFILLMLAPQLGFTQYKSFFGKEVTMGFRELIHLADVPGSFDQTVSYNSDSVEWGGQYYHKLVHTYKRTGSLMYVIYAREVVDSGRMYLYDTAVGAEFLYIDMTLNKGDTFRTNIQHSQPIYVDSVFYVDSLRHLTLRSKSWDYYMEWAEGVGALKTSYRDTPNNIIAIVNALDERSLYCLFKDGKHFYTEFLLQTMNYDCNRLLSIGGDLDKSVSVSIYPNPAQDVLHVRNVQDNSKLLVKVYDLGGKLVLYETVQDNKPVSLQNVFSGLYIVRIFTENGENVLNTKLMVSN